MQKTFVTIVSYDGNSTRFRTENPRISGVYSLQEYIEVLRMEYDCDFDRMKKHTLFNEDSYKKLIEPGSKIYQSDLKMLTKVMKIPRNVIKLAIDNVRPTLAKNLTTMRMDKDLTQKEVSEILGIAQTTYAGYETGKNEPDVNTLIKLAKLYKTSIDILVNEIK